MKRGWRGWAVDLLAILAIWLCGSGIAWANSQASTSEGLIQIETVLLEESAKPDQSAVLKLPIHTYRDKREFAAYRASTTFDLDASQVQMRLSLYLQVMYDGGRIWVNGQEIGDVPTATEQTTVRHVRPFMFNLPSQHLKVGQNHLAIEWVSRETMLSVSRMFVGPAHLIKPHFERRFFWQNTMAQVSFVFAFLIAALMLGVFANQRQDTQYLLVGLSSLGWTVLNVGYFLPPMPSWFFPYWRFFFYVMISFFATCGWLYVLRESGNSAKGYAAACKLWAVIGPLGYLLNFWATGATYFPWVEGVWGVGCALMGLYPLYCLMKTWWKFRRPRHLLFLSSASLSMTVGVLDTLQLVGKTALGGVGYSLQVVAPIWFACVSGVLISDFVRSLRMQEEQRALMNVRLQEQEFELIRLHRQEQVLEREKATRAERERIMQDMHDGLGSQLISSLALSQKGMLAPEQTAQLLRACIDDLRLAIDASGADAQDLGVAAGNLRFRMTPRLKAVGITLVWRMEELADDLPLKASDVLAILRIVQEAMANAIKHAQATRLEVTMRSTGTHLHVSISDDGIGFAEITSASERGKGLSGMLKRARGLNAELTVNSLPQMTSTATNTQHGVRIELQMPLRGNTLG